VYYVFTFLGTKLPNITQTLHQSLSSVKVISGSLIIKSNFSNDSTFLSNLSMLQNLKLILGVGDWRTTQICSNSTVVHCDR